MTTPAMPSIVVEQELGKSIKINLSSGPLVPGRYEVNVDNDTIVIDPVSGKISAVNKTTSIGLDVVSQTANNVDIPLDFFGDTTSNLYMPTTFKLVVGPDGLPLLDGDGNRQVIPVYSITASGQFFKPV